MVDDAGWEYAIEASSKNWSSTMTVNRNIRRRLWRRRRIMKPKESVDVSSCFMYCILFSPSLTLSHSPSLSFTLPYSPSLSLTLSLTLPHSPSHSPLLPLHSLPHCMYYWCREQQMKSWSFTIPGPMMDSSMLVCLISSTTLPLRGCPWLGGGGGSGRWSRRPRISGLYNNPSSTSNQRWVWW